MQRDLYSFYGRIERGHGPSHNVEGDGIKAGAEIAVIVVNSHYRLIL